MKWFMLAVWFYCGSGAITTWLVIFKLGPQNQKFLQRWEYATAYVPGWLLVVVTFLLWPMPAWKWRHGRREADKG